MARESKGLIGLAIAFLALALANAAGAAPVEIDLIISYFDATNPQPPPIFQGSQLTGFAQFFKPVVVDAGPGFLPEGPPIDIGTLAIGHSFTTVFTPTDPCFGDGTCSLNFAFLGTAAGFPAVALSPFATPPSEAPSPPPIIPIGTLSSQPTPPPIRLSGPIFAFDDPVQVGSWDVNMRIVPGPIVGAGLPGLVAGFGVLLLWWRQRRNG